MRATELSGGQTWGERIEYCGSHITLLGLGQHAPLDAKTAWIRISPSESDYRRCWSRCSPASQSAWDVDKAYGICMLAEVIQIPAEDIISIGDTVYPGDNDYPIREAGIDTIAVRDTHKTKRVIEAISPCLRDERRSVSSFRS